MTSPLEPEAVQKDFPVLSRRQRGGRRLVYLDNAATSQRPVQVIQAMTRFYEEHNANVHRGVYQLAAEATAAYEKAHEHAARFVKAGGLPNAVFTKNCTEAINIVASGWAMRKLKAGDEILSTQMEHHANIVPWQEVGKLTGAKVRFAPITKEGTLDVGAWEEMLTSRTKIVTFCHASNVLGTINPARELTEKAHDAGARVLVDGAQSVPHMPVDFARIGCDWLAFSGHKMLGPTGIGVLVGTEEALNDTYPLIFGGEMIRKVSFEGAEWNELPWKFEAGTPVVAEAVGLDAAIEYLEKLGMENVHEHGERLARSCIDHLAAEGCDIYGPRAGERVGVTAFNVPDVHPHDLASILDDEGIAVRAGHHCAMPLMGVLKVPATARASFYVYNTQEDVEALARGVHRAREVMGV